MGLCILDESLRKRSGFCVFFSLLLDWKASREVGAERRLACVANEDREACYASNAVSVRT